jgi:hypothetical protein
MFKSIWVLSFFSIINIQIIIGLGKFKARLSGGISVKFLLILNKFQKPHAR